MASTPHEWKYADPHAEEFGLLLSHRIDELCKQGLLIREGYQPAQLRPASYTLTIGPDFLDSDGVQGKLTEEKPTLLFPKNSIVWVSSAEQLDLPFYVVARFNLRVQWVYDGVLLGTGPQVDPGFLGYLSCPLYNLTNSDLIITRGEPFATIDFEKTTPSGLTPEEMQAVAVQQKESVDAPDGLRHLFFTQKPMKPLAKKAKHQVISSLKELKDEIRSWRVIGVAVLLSFLGLCLTLLQFGGTVFRESQAASSRAIDEVRRASSAEARIRELERRLLLLEGAGTSPTGGLAPKAAPSPAGKSPAPSGKSRTTPSSPPP